MLTIHLVTQDFLPQKGGLERWTFCLAKLLKAMGHDVVIHVMTERMPIHDASMDLLDGIKFDWLCEERSVWEAPLLYDGGSVSNSEKWRINFLCLRNAVARAIDESPERRHVLISNYLLSPGHLASMAAENLSIPHIACVVGTDFSRGFRNTIERTTIGNVVKQATFVVTLCYEQEHSLTRAFALSNVTTIHTSVDQGVFENQWVAQKTDKIRLFSDCGFSHKKGTQALMAAFESLAKEGLPVTLTICGNTQEGQESYWRQLQDACIKRLPLAVSFHEFLEPTEIWRHIVASDVYCSATLGEGCSLARVAALCIGIPIVSTSCGELPDLTAESTHVRLAKPGDFQGFTSELRKLCREYSEGNLKINHDALETWRTYFAPAREFQEWQTLLDKVDTD